MLAMNGASCVTVEVAAVVVVVVVLLIGVQREFLTVELNRPLGQLIWMRFIFARQEVEREAQAAGAASRRTYKSSEQHWTDAQLHRLIMLAFVVERLSADAGKVVRDDFV